MLVYGGPFYGKKLLTLFPSSAHNVKVEGNPGEGEGGATTRNDGWFGRREGGGGSKEALMSPNWAQEGGGELSR